MRDFHSFLAPHMESFVMFQTVAGRWNITYDAYLSYFDKYCCQVFPDESVLREEMTDGWCALRDTESNNTRRIRIYAIANFVKYMRARGMTSIPVPAIPKQKRSAYIPHAFTDAELGAFFHACDNLPMSKPKALSVRIRRFVVPVFFRLLYSTGIRTYEARMLEIGDVDLEEGILCIRTAKGGNQYYVAMHSTMAELMRTFDRAIRTICPKRRFFFQSARGSFFSKEWVVQTFRSIWKKANESNATAYELRHNYAVTNINGWICDGFDFFDKMVYLSKSMGHLSLESTKRYYHLAPAMSEDILRLTGVGFDEIVPEVPHEES